MVKTILIPIEDHPTKVPILAEFTPRWRKKNLKYDLEMNPGEPIDRQQFRRLLFNNSIAWDRLNGRSKDLAAFEPSLNEKPIAGVVEEIVESYGKLTELREVHQTRQAEAVIIQEVINGSTDVEQTEKVYTELNKKRNEAELANLKVETLGRKLESLKVRILAEIRAKEEARFKELMAQARAQIKAFNESVRSAYSELSKLFPFFAELAELKPGEFPGSGFIFQTPFIRDAPMGTSLKTFRGCPQIFEQSGQFAFDLVTLKTEETK